MSTTIAAIPSQFILYIPTRSTERDPFAQYLLINAKPTPDGKATRLDPAPHVASSMPSYVIKKIHLNLPYTPSDIPVHSILLNINNNMPLGATFMKLANQHVIPPEGGQPLIVLRLHNGRLTDFLPSHLKRNIPMKEEKPTVVTSPAPPQVTSPPALTPVGGAGTASAPAPAPTSLLDVASQISQIMSSSEAVGDVVNQINHLLSSTETVGDFVNQMNHLMSSPGVAAILPPPFPSPLPAAAAPAVPTQPKKSKKNELPPLPPNLLPSPPPAAAAAPAVPAPAPPKKVKKTAAPLLSPVGDLNPHVAKQLLALARLRKEECPIIAEEFSDGNTAVMPCGHLFSRMGIEESFKKEPRKCPACRSPGNPTLV